MESLHRYGFVNSLEPISFWSHIEHFFFAYSWVLLGYSFTNMIANAVAPHCWNILKRSILNAKKNVRKNVSGFDFYRWMWIPSFGGVSAFAVILWCGRSIFQSHSEFICKSERMTLAVFSLPVLSPTSQGILSSVKVMEIIEKTFFFFWTYSWWSDATAKCNHRQSNVYSFSCSLNS